MAITNPFDPNQPQNQDPSQTPFGGQAAASPAYPNSMSAGNVVQDYVNGFLGANSSYVQNAQQRAKEQASGRGLLNSSIAAGAGQRAAIESVQPWVSQAMGLHGQREQNAFSGEQQANQNAFNANQTFLQQQYDSEQAQLNRNQSNEQFSKNLEYQGGQAALDRGLSREQLAAQQGFQGTQADLDRQQQANLQHQQLQYEAQQAQLGRDHETSMAQVQDWLNNQQFTREQNAALARIPIESVAQFNDYLQQAALNDPEAFTPSVVSGLTQFMNTNFLTTLRDIFPDIYGE